ncbi:unnamed protein product [Closterium sp. NIES-64]|nr:unnamed protein product [Closterium sp. NIES-64]
MESPSRPARNAAVCLCFALALLLVVLVLSTDPPCTHRGLSTLEFSSLAPSFGCNFPILSPIASLVSSSLLPFPPPTLAYSIHGADATPSARTDSPSHAAIRDPLDRASHSSRLRRPSPQSHGVGDASAILPEYLGHVATGGEGLAWGDRCFEQVTARLAREPGAEGEGGSDGARVRAVDGRQAAATVTLSVRDSLCACHMHPVSCHMHPVSCHMHPVSCHMHPVSPVASGIRSPRTSMHSPRLVSLPNNSPSDKRSVLRRLKTLVFPSLPTNMSPDATPTCPVASGACCCARSCTVYAPHHAPLPFPPTPLPYAIPVSLSPVARGACCAQTCTRSPIFSSLPPTMPALCHPLPHQPRGKRRMLCTDVYALATPFHLVVRVLPLALPHPITVPWPAMGPLEMDYVQQRGVAVFRLPHGLWGAVKALLQLLPLASDSSVGEAAQMRFLQQHMHASFHPHVPLAPPPDLSLPAATAFLSSGDLLLTSKFRGPWGLFETIEKWVTGSYAAHAALLLRTDAAGSGAGGGGDRGEGVGDGKEGELWVAESGRISVAGRPEIAVERFSEWWRRMQRDPSGQHVVVLRLGEEGRRRWDNGRAWAFVRAMEGRQFGYHNIMFSWIDTPANNFPPPINENTVAALAAVWSRVQPEYAARIWNEALNRRLGTQNLSLEQVLVECQRQNISFGQLLALPEQDSWRYSDGLSLSCVAFALRVWKEAGVFGPMGDNINVSEFTIRDAYQLQLFASNASHLPSWCFSQDQSEEEQAGKEDKLGRKGIRGTREAMEMGHSTTRGVEGVGGARAWCQLLGKWRFDLPGFNSIPLYAHMNERCPTLPPNYMRPSSC